jgi:hypothetical protein
MATGNLFGTGGESNSLYGAALSSSGASSFIYFEWTIYRVSASQPATPTGGTWNFLTNTGTTPTGWVNFVAGTPLNNLWFSVAFIDSRNPTSIIWSEPGLLSANTFIYATVYVNTFTGNGATVAFTLTNSPVSENYTNVYINGVYQQKNTYSVAGAVITFSEAPPVTSSIEVNYV